MSRRKAAAGGVAAAMEEETSPELRRGPWTQEEDNLLMGYIACHGEGRWNLLARSSGLKRTGKSCRLRWLNYLKPDIKRGNLAPEEQLLILELHSKWGNRWSRIAQQLPGRTDNEIKNYWRTRVQKQARQLKVDANSAVFLDAVRCYWMPRLLEKMTAAPPQTSSPVMTMDVPVGSCCGQLYACDPSPSTSTSTAAALPPPVPCFSEPSWADQYYYPGDLDGAGDALDLALLGSLGLDGLDLGPAAADCYSITTDSTLLDYLSSSCCTAGAAMTTMTTSGGGGYYCGGGDHYEPSVTCQAARKQGSWWGGGI